MAVKHQDKRAIQVCDVCEATSERRQQHMGTVLLGRQGYRRHKLGISLLVVYIVSHFCLDVGKGDCCCWNRRNPRLVI